MAESTSKTCPCCSSLDVQEVVLIKNVPTHCNILWKDRNEALACSKGDIQLNFCHHCGHLYNQAFDASLMTYSQEYENALDFSPAFQNYSQELVERLTRRYSLHNKDIVEIGCGKGNFLKLICTYGGNRGYGFDKSYDPSLEKNQPVESVAFIQDFYEEKYSHYPADFIVARHVLEHIDQPDDFLSGIRDISTKNGQERTFYVEVPNALYTLRDLSIWDLIYEHCSYFSAPSLAGLFKRLGFHVLNVRENYRGQFLSIEATTHHTQNGYQPDIDVADVYGKVEKFADSFAQKMTGWHQKLGILRAQGKKVVVWGGGSKGVAFLNFLPTADYIRHIVDINPRKTGRYVAGTGQQYVAPDSLKEIQPDTVIIMNPVYQEEISGSLKQMGLSPEVVLA